MFAVYVQRAENDNIALQCKYEKKNSKWLIHKARLKNQQKRYVLVESQQHFLLNGK